MRVKIFYGREPWNENFLLDFAVVSDGKGIEYARRLPENLRLRDVVACVPFRKFQRNCHACTLAIEF